MTPQEAIDLLRLRLKVRGESNQISSHLVTALNAAQLELELGPTYPFFLETYLGGISPSEKFNGFETPDNFIVEHEYRPISWTDGVNTIDLEKRFFEELVKTKNIPGTAPYFYAIVGGTDVYTFPTIQTGTYSMRYYAHMTQITKETLTTTNKWYKFAPFLLIAKAGFTYASNSLGDMELAQVFAKQEADAMQQLIALNTQQEIAKHDLSEMRLRN